MTTIDRWARPWCPSSNDPEWGLTSMGWTTTPDRGTVRELIQDILETHRGQWLGVPHGPHGDHDIQSIAVRVRSGINVESVRVEALGLARSCTSVERRILCLPRFEGGGRVVTEEQIQLRVQ